MDQNLIWRNLWSGAVFIFVCAPLFLLSIVLGAIMIYRREAFGIASIVINVLVVAAVILVHAAPAMFSGRPETRARREEARARAWQKEQVLRANGGILIDENAWYFRLVQERWWTVVCGCVLAGGVCVHFVYRKRRRADEDAGREGQGAPAGVCCPQCHADVSGIIRSGLSRCHACNVELVGSRKNADEVEGGTFPQMVAGGSTAERVAAVTGIVIWIGLAVWWVALRMQGFYIESKSVAASLAIATCAILALFGVRYIFR